MRNFNYSGSDFEESSWLSACIDMCWDCKESDGVFSDFMRWLKQKLGMAM